MQSKGHTSLDTRHKGESLQDDCTVFAWKFFLQKQQHGHEQAEEPLSTYVVVRVNPSSDPVQMLMLCDDPKRPS
ncbi:hypothetical protein TNCV_2177641 [Trichonephila clavipes]|uniref:Uncharacterized protein n=1 Tax=Trichonephila clavipes TaxID=2585209 RepID=A0A8X7B7X3_TRICX|nr:hypothetical protein TNCV_2177641 [Trichonephila clavipes]